MKRVIAVLMVLCAGLVSVLGVGIYRRLQLTVLDIKPPSMSFRAARQTLPFSVIPGGVFDTRDLADSMAQDPVVRDHYRDLQTDRMWFTRLKKPMLAYVSFRKDGRVGWTSHPVVIAANELVLTDGNKMVRARCGNRIELKRPKPLPSSVVPPELPPPDIALETGIPDLVPPTLVPPVAPGSQIASNTPPHASPQGTTWCCGVTSNLASVPEPPSFFLVGCGSLALFAFGGRKLI